MRLIRLRLHNFRQHADTEVVFSPGLTGIIGPNGAGKSTILEAIGWAIYGSAAVRGTNETIRFARAPERSRVRVELVFDLAGHEYRVVRSMSNAEVYLDEGDDPVASSIGGATAYLESRIGMTRQEFFNTYFTGQKELQFLAQMGPAQRARFLSEVLGYERLRRAQERTRARRNELRHEVEGLRAGLADPDELDAGVRAAEQRREEAVAARDEASAGLREAEGRREELEPRWKAARTDRDRARELEHRIDVTRRERDTAEREGRRAAEAMETIEAADVRLDRLRERLAPLPDVVQECERLAELARHSERRRALEKSERILGDELAAGERRLEKLERAPDLAERYRAEVQEARRELEEVDARVERLRSGWVEQRQEVKTRLETYRDRAQELKEQLQMLREAGPDGTCPACERPLGDEFDPVVERLDDEWQEVVQDGKWLSQRLEQLESEPGDLADGEARRAELRTAVEERGRRLARCERAMQELKRLRRDRRKKEERRAELREEISSLPADYDPERHRDAERRLRELRELERRASRLEQTVGARPERERERDEARARFRSAKAELEALERERAELGFDEASFEELRRAHERAVEDVRTAELRLTELRGALRAAEEALETATRAREEYRGKRSRLDEREGDLRHHNELDGAFTQLRAELNARVRPELSELASAFLAEITEGRYTSLEIDDDYNILVLDEGEEKPVISGGEEDIANLVLRLAISQMIAERAGHLLSVLILDEVFGSLDLERRDNVVELLHRIGNRFEQVILITHVETIREGLDTIIRVGYDERTGASVVEGEGIGAAS